MPMVVGCLTRKNIQECLAIFSRCLVVFVDFFIFCYFGLLFLLFVSFVIYFLLLKGVRFVTFYYYFYWIATKSVEEGQDLELGRGSRVWELGFAGGF
jgi:hypothetical protein